jgi:hypothetical protein
VAERRSDTHVGSAAWISVSLRQVGGKGAKDREKEKERHPETAGTQRREVEMGAEIQIR